jgi:hypothetical protein
MMGILTKIAFSEQTAAFGGRRRRRWILQLRSCRSPAGAHGIGAMHYDKVDGLTAIMRGY